jgi:ribulose-phosphate 3-epimerase
MQNYIIAPSLLSANFARLGDDARAVLAAGADALHLDVMDNHYVPNLTVGPMVCEALRRDGIQAPIDVHLMVNPVDRLIVEFAKAGATSITFHPDASEHIDRSLALIRQHGCKAGIAVNPATTLSCLDDIWEKIDLILIMSVNPGFGGQAFIPETLEKISTARQLINKHNKTIRLAVDGGVNIKNIYRIAQAGADTFIAGSAIFKESNYTKTIQLLRDELKN